MTFKEIQRSLNIQAQRMTEELGVEIFKCVSISPIPKEKPKRLTKDEWAEILKELEGDGSWRIDFRDRK